MNKMDRDNLMFDLSQPVYYPDGMIYEQNTGKMVPRMALENFGKMYLELCELKVILIRMLEAENGPG